MTVQPRTGFTASRWLIAGEWRAHPVRALVGVLAIAVGVALGFAVHLVNSAALDSFARAISTVAGAADLQVHGVTPAGFDERLYPRVARLAGVAAVSPVVELPALGGAMKPGGRVTLLGIDMLRAVTVTPALVGVPMTGTGAAAGFRSDALFASRAALARLGRRPGEAVTLTAAGRSHEFRIAGVLGGAGEDQALLVGDIADVQWRFGQLGRLQRLDIALAPGADRAVVERRVRTVLPVDAEIVTAASEAGRSDALSRAYRVNLGMLAMVALLTGGFLVYSAQSLSVARRRPQFALLRVLGLNQRTLVRQVLVEGLILGAAGSALGLGLGYALADFAVRRFGGDLGGGYFSGVAATLAFPPLPALGFAGLGLAVAVAGSVAPALSAARAQPAVALKGTGETVDPRDRPRAWLGLAMLAAGGLAALGPPVFALPLLGYAAMALLLAGGVALMPALARLLLTPLLGHRRLPPALDLAVRRLWGAPSQAAVALCGIVASTSLMVAMAVMVASFRGSVDEWLGAVLPADIYLHLEGAEAGGMAPDVQARLAATAGIAEARFVRQLPLRLATGRPPVTLAAQTLTDGRPDLPIVAQVTVPAGMVPVWVSEPMSRIYRLSPGMTTTLPLGGAARPVFVAGIWRDYARQFGAVAMGIPDYRRLTGDATATEAAFLVRPGADEAAVLARLRAALPAQVAAQAMLGRSGQLRAQALTIFDRSFAVTYALEAIAIVIGLVGVATTFSAQTLSRRREFGMLRHLGVARREVLTMLAAEGGGLGLVGALAGVALGMLMAQVLIHVVNPQSFNWTMDTRWPWGLLAGLVAALVAAAAGTAMLSGRQALSDDTVRAVRDDW